MYDVGMRCEEGGVTLRWTARRRYSSFDTLYKVWREGVCECECGVEGGG